MRLIPAVLSIIITLALSAQAFAQTFSLFRITSSNHALLNTVASEYEIVSHKGKNRYEIYVPVEKIRAFKKLVPGAVMLQTDVDADWRHEFHHQTKFASGYHDWQGVQDFISEAVLAYPLLASTKPYGASKQGHVLSYLRLGTQSQDPSFVKPKIFLDAATHGDELISTEVLLALADELLKGYGSDSRLSAILDSVDIYFSFVVNPDGYIKQQRYDNGVDPNRSYPWPNDPTHKPTASIQALMDLFETERFDGSISFHAYGRLLMYPWAYTLAPLAEESERLKFQDLTEKLSEENGYTYGPIASTIYVAKGSSVDYYYWKYRTKALAVELSTSKVPSASRIPSVTDEAREMVWAYLESF